jgi:hypothetical protein
MSRTALTLVCLLPSTVCAAVGGWLCYAGRDGWGWFLFVAVLLYTIPGWRGETTEDEEE